MTLKPYSQPSVPSRVATAVGMALAVSHAVAKPDTDSNDLRSSQPVQQTCDASAKPQDPSAQPCRVPSWKLETVTVNGQRGRYEATASSAGTKTLTPLLEVPQSIQVITRSLMDEQDRRTLGDALVNVSGVVANKPEEGGLAGPLVRGFLAEIYQDGLPMYGSTQAVNDPTSLVGISRIEVLKGPTSALYGGGVGSPLGGLINIESKRPDATPGGFLALRAGSFSTWNPYGEINVPIVPGVAARLAGEYQRNGSWIDQLSGKRWFLQPSISFQLADTTDLLLQAQVSRREQLEYSGIPASQALAGTIDRNAFAGAPVGQRPTSTDNRMATAILRHGFGDDTRLTVSARRYLSKTPQYGSFVYPDLYAPDASTPTLYPILAMNMMTTIRESTLDANVSGVMQVLGGTHRWLAGLNGDWTDFSSDMGFEGVPVGNQDLADPTYNLGFGALAPLSLTQTDRYETGAVYLQDQATYGPVHLTGSLRYTQLKFREKEMGTHETFHRLSPRLGATVDIAPGVALYAGYATAFRGAFGLVSLQRPRPETSSNIEAGLKFSLGASHLSGSIALFQQKRDNVATADPDHLLYSIQTGQQRARGVETDLLWEPTPALSLLATYAYTQAEVTRDNAIPVGDTLPRVPKHNARLAARYRILQGAAQGLSFGAGVSAFSAKQLTLPNTVSVPGYATVDAQASYEWDRYTLSLSLVNVTGRKVFDTYQYFAFPVVMPTQPRSGYVTLSARF